MIAESTVTSLSKLAGVGSYSSHEAARLLRTPKRNIDRWMRGYQYRRKGETHHVAPLWRPQHNLSDSTIELGFRDLIELRFVAAFLDAGLHLLTIRNCLEYARDCVSDEHPFSTQRFQTDGKTIFLESIDRASDIKLLDLKRKQYAFKQVIERSFKDLDIEDGAVARWRPFKGKSSIVIDPERAFGQPITSRAGIPTAVLADAVEAEGSAERAARVFEVTVSVVRDALAFEQTLDRP